MLFYSFFCVCFLAILAPKIETKEKTNSDTEKSEAIFADVIKNISRVNNVLQELINNYEQLQKIYKSQENFDAPEYSSEADVDRFNKNNKKIARDKERSFFQYSPSDKSTTVLIRETQMILSENEAVDKSHELKTVTPAVDQAKPVKEPKIEKLDEAEKKPVVQKITTEQTEQVAETSDETSTSAEVIEIATKPTRPTTIKTTTTTTTTQKPRLIEPEIIFVDTHKKMQEKIEKKKPRIMPEIALEQAPKKLKTRYSVKEMPGSKDASYGVVKSSKVFRETRNSSKPGAKRFLQIESLTKLDPPSEESDTAITKKAVEKEDYQPDETKSRAILRSQAATNKSAKLFVANDKGDGLETSSEMTDDDDALTKDLFKTSVLRQAYGDACLKLVVRKCYKACGQVLKSSCRVTKCKSEIKSFFKKQYQHGCDKAFEDTPDYVPCRRVMNNEDPHIDFTREGYLSAACQTHTETGLPITLQTDRAQNTEQNKDSELNILRNRYEKACQRLSQDKCQGACDYAQNATCHKYQCDKNFKKRLRRNCSTQCKRAYKSTSSKGKRSSGSDSDSDSESSS